MEHPLKYGYILAAGVLNSVKLNHFHPRKSSLFFRLIQIFFRSFRKLLQQIVFFFFISFRIYLICKSRRLPSERGRRNEKIEKDRLINLYRNVEGIQGKAPAEASPASAISTRGLYHFPQTTYGQRKAKRSKSNNFDIENRTFPPLFCLICFLR